MLAKQEKTCFYQRTAVVDWGDRSPTVTTLWKPDVAISRGVPIPSTHIILARPLCNRLFVASEGFFTLRNSFQAYVEIFQ